MMYRILTFLLVLFLLNGCEWVTNNQIEGKLTDRYTGEPLADVEISFNVASGGGMFGGTLERDKYQTVTDKNGGFLLDDLGDDVEHFMSVASMQSNGSLVGNKINSYLDRGFRSDSLWIVQGVNYQLKVKPKGTAIIWHPKKLNPECLVDTIIISAYYQRDTIHLEKQQSTNFHFMPDESVNLSLDYIVNGKVTRKEINCFIYSAYTVIGNGTLIKENEIHLPNL